MSSIDTARRFALSRRAEAMPASPIRRLAPLAEAAKARGVKVYHLNIGQPDIETPACMRDRLHQLDIRGREQTLGVLAILNAQEIAAPTSVVTV